MDRGKAGGGGGAEGEGGDKLVMNLERSSHRGLMCAGEVPILRWKGGAGSCGQGFEGLTRGMGVGVLVAGCL